VSGECNWCGADHTEADCVERPIGCIISEFEEFGNVDGTLAPKRLAQAARLGAAYEAGELTTLPVNLKNLPKANYRPKV
jgi:hypothetical protein